METMCDTQNCLFVIATCPKHPRFWEQNTSDKKQVAARPVQLEKELRNGAKSEDGDCEEQPRCGEPDLVEAVVLSRVLGPGDGNPWQVPRQRPFCSSEGMPDARRRARRRRRVQTVLRMPARGGVVFSSVFINDFMTDALRSVYQGV